MLDFTKHDTLKANLLSQTLPLHATIYTDGSFKQPLTGYGIHGYFYLDTEPKAGHGCDGFIPTKRGYVQTGGKPPITVLNYFNAMGNYTDGTNNSAEAFAFVHALAIVKEFGVKSVEFILDSQYVLRGAFEWLPKWRENNWCGQNGAEIANKTIWMDIDFKLRELKDMGVAITSRWTKGHAGEYGNTVADGLANTAVEIGRKARSIHMFTAFEPKEYWKAEIETHPLLTESRFFFTDKTDGTLECGRYVYHMGSSCEDENYGKIDPEASYSVVITPDCDPVIEMVRNFQKSSMGSFSNGIFSAALDNIMKPKIYREIKNTGDLFLRAGSKRHDTIFADGSVLAREISNPRRLFRAFDTMTLLQNYLEMWIEKRLPDFFTVNEITSHIFQEKAGKKKDSLINALIAEDSASFKVPVTYKNMLATEERSIEITLNYGQDLPKRRALNNMADLKPRIYVITIPECDRAFRYQTIVECNGSFGIWAGVFSNLRIDTNV